MKRQTKTTIRMLKAFLLRSFAVGGYTFFGLIVATQDIQMCFTASLIAGGSYFFTELMRYSKATPSRKRFNCLLFA